MSYNIKSIASPVGRRFQNITLSEDGSAQTTIQVGTISTSPNEDKSLPDNVIFDPIASSSCYISKAEIDAALGAITDAEVGIDLRLVVESRLEVILRAKGVLKV